MQNYRKRMIVQKKHSETPKARQVHIKPTYRELYFDTKAFLVKVVLMYKVVVASFEPLSDEEKLCRDEILKYTIDLEILQHGTYEERKEVIRKHGRLIS